MKIRNGFVSNSSSSSFMIYGIDLDLDKLDLLLKKHGIKSDNEDDDDDMYELYEQLEDIVAEKGLDLLLDWEGECAYIGLSRDEIKDEETGLEFKQRVTNGILGLFTNVPIDSKLLAPSEQAGEICS